MLEGEGKKGSSSVSAEKKSDFLVQLIVFLRIPKNPLIKVIMQVQKIMGLPSSESTATAIFKPAVLLLNVDDKVAAFEERTLVTVVSTLSLLDENKLDDSDGSTSVTVEESDVNSWILSQNGPTSLMGWSDLASEYGSGPAWAISSVVPREVKEQGVVQESVRSMNKVSTDFGVCHESSCVERLWLSASCQLDEPTIKRSIE